MSDDRSLPIPPVMATDHRSTEIVRVWVGSGQSHFTILPLAWKDPAVWGILLADLARHVATEYSKETSTNTDEVIARVRAAFDVEMNHPTSRVNNTPDMSS